MPVPKKRTSRSKRDMRRAHDALSFRSSIMCPKCGAAKLRHRACAECGEYRGRQAIAVKEGPK